MSRPAFRLWLLLAALLVLAARSPSAGQFPGLKGQAAQHVTVTTGADRATASPGGAVSLWLDVVPQSNIHVYAQGAKGFTPVALTVTPNPNIVTPSRVKYPAAERLSSPGTDERVPVYAKPFRIVQPVTIAKGAKPGSITIGATLTYESCDDRLCYPAAMIPVGWTITVK